MRPKTVFPIQDSLGKLAKKKLPIPVRLRAQQVGTTFKTFYVRSRVASMAMKRFPPSI